MSSPTSTPRKRRYAKRLPMPERREQLLDAALRVLARDGYDRVSVDAIAKEAGVTRPVVYGAYDGLEPLLHALLDRTQERAMASVAQVLPQDPDLSDPDQFLLDVTAGAIDMVQDDPDVWRPILGMTRNAPAIVQDRIDGDREAVRSYIAELLDVGLALRGGPDLDTEVVSHLIFVTLEHFGRLVLEEPPRYDKERLVTALGGLLTVVRPTHEGSGEPPQ